jgi:hypothetical protein
MSLSGYFGLGSNLSLVSSTKELGSDHFFTSLKSIAFRLDYINHPKFKIYVNKFKRILKLPNRVEFVRDRSVLLLEIFNLLNCGILNAISRKLKTVYRLGYKLGQFKSQYNTPQSPQIYASLCMLNEKMIDYNLFPKSDFLDQNSLLLEEKIPDLVEKIENCLSYP